MEKALTRVTFEFEDKTKRVLEGEELETWGVICSLKSDYLLPGATDHVLASAYDGLVRGFVPSAAIGPINWKKEV